MRSLFIADAHLRHPDDANYRSLLNFLDAQRGRLDHLCLLGDIFEFWIGYRQFSFPVYAPFLEKIRQLKDEGTQIYYAEGNHDFRLGPLWQDLTQGRVFTEGAQIELEGQCIYMAHGDLMDPSDKGYRLLRHFLRSPVLGMLKSAVPPDLAWKIAQWASRQSKKTHSRPRDLKRLENLLRAHAEVQLANGCSVVITGHHHSPMMLETQKGLIISLGDWITQNSYALLEDGKFSLCQAP